MLQNIQEGFLWGPGCKVLKDELDLEGKEEEKQHSEYKPSEASFGHRSNSTVIK